MKRRFSIGVVGTGMWGDTHVKCLKEDSRATVSWICARTRTSLDAAMERHGVVNGTLDYRRILGDDAVDAVVIATPPHTHAEMAVAAMRAGKHVLLEKPMGITPAEVKRIVAEAKRHPRRVVLEASCRISRTQPKFAFVKKLVDSGALGTVYHIHFQMMIPTTFVDYNPKGAWGAQKKLAGGGPVIDWGEYDFSFLLGVLGDAPKVERVQRFSRNDLRRQKLPGGIVPDVEQHAAAFIVFDNGVTCYYERGASAHMMADCEVRICGTKGGLKFSYLEWDRPEIEFFRAGRNGTGPTERKTLAVDMARKPDNCNTLLVRHFLDCLEGKAKPMMPVERAAKHLLLSLKIAG